MKRKITSLLLTLLLTGTLAFAFNTQSINTESGTTMSEPFELKTYLQGYTPNKIILYDLLDNADEAEWYAHPREEQIPFGQDLGEEGATRYEYNMTLEDGKTYDRAVMVRPNANLTPDNRSDIVGKWFIDLPNVTPLYLKAEWGFAPDANPETEVRASIDGWPVTLPGINSYSSFKPSDHLHGFLVDLSDLAGQFEVLILYVIREEGSIVSPSYWTKAFIFTIEGEDYNTGEGTYWLEYPQTYGGYFELVWNLGDRFDPTVGTWIGYADIDHPVLFRGYAYAFKLLGYKILMGGSFWDERTEEMREDPEWGLYPYHPELRNATIIDIHGDPVVLSTFYGAPYKRMDLTNPDWQNYLKSQMLMSIDIGIEGSTFDVIAGNIANLEDPSTTCFSPSSIRGFREWLANRYTQEEFDGIIGKHIPIEEFDYRSYLIESGLDDDYLSRRDWTVTENQNEVPLSHDYDLYTIEAAVDFLKNATQEATEYAADLGREYLFTGNDRPDQLLGIGVFTSGTLDLYHLEMPYIKGGPWQSRIGALSPVDRRVIINSLLANDVGPRYKGRQVPVVIMPTAAWNSIYNKEQDEDATRAKILFAQAYSSQASIIWAGLNGMEPNISEIGKYARFILSNPLALEKTTSNHKIGVLHPQTSISGRSALFTGNFTPWGINENQDARDAFWGACFMLLDSHNQFDVIFSGDNLIVDDRLSLADLEKYETVILPNAFCLTENQVNVILDYVRNGENVIAFGETGTCDENNTEVSRPDLESLAVPGTHSYGNGTFAYLGGSEKENIGIDYFVDRRSDDLNEFKTAIESLMQPQVLSTASIDTSILTYVGEGGRRLIAHIVNSNYDNVTTDIEPQPPFNLSIEIPQNFSLEGKKAYLISPDTPDVLELNYTVENGYLTFEIPEVYIYSVLIVTEPVLFESSRALHQANLWTRDAKFDDVYISDIDETLKDALTAYNQGEYQEAKDLSMKVVDDVQNRVNLRDVTWSAIIARELMGLDVKNVKEAFYQGDYELAYSLLAADLNLDGVVNILDIAIVARAFGSRPGDPNWNEIADIDKNGIINILDIAAVAKDYGKTA